MKKMTTSYYKPVDEKEWLLVDLRGKTVGRVATEIASILRGKHKATYTPHVDNGDFVVAINSDKLTFTGNKMSDKVYYSYSGYIGGLKEITAEKLIKKDSTKVLIHAVKGMLPKGPLGRQMLKKLKVYSGPAHEQAAQKPRSIEL